MPKLLPTKIGHFRGTYRFLSNFYESAFRFEGFDYKTAEHAYQAQKTADPQKQVEIRNADTPGRAKRLGREVVLIPNWDAEKDDVMFQILKAKFQNEELRDKLLATGNALLEEGNDWGDTYWGVYNGRGENMLGRLLMVLREDLRMVRNDAGCDHEH